MLPEHCEYTDWTIQSFLGKINGNSIILPKYQRGISWTLPRQQKLINSIRRGFPVGAILLAKSVEASNGTESYRIIDGLQRTTAIRRFYAEPTKYVGTSDDDYLDEWREFASWVGSEVLGQMLSPAQVNEMLSGILKMSPSGQIDRLDLYRSIIARGSNATLDSLEGNSELESRAKSFVDSVKDELNLANVKIPVIIYRGPDEDLPLIFERLNSQGVSLSRYEIFAAKWQSVVVDVDADVFRAIKTFYLQRLEDATLEIENVDVDGTPTEVTLFDYLTGLGQVLASQFPVLFSEEWAGTIAFQITSVAHRLHPNKMSGLEDAVRGATPSEIRLEKFRRAVIAVCTDVDRALRGRLNLNLNSQGRGKSFAGHTEFQIATIVTRLLVEHFDTATWDEVVSSNQRKNLDQYVRRWYLADRVRRIWGNAGDTQFYKRVWSIEEDVHLPNRDTLLRYSDQDLDAALESWFVDEMGRNDQVRKRVTNETQLVLRYFYYSKLSVQDEEEEVFHIDHLVPIKWWRELRSKGIAFSGPINSIGNLCLMYKADNSTKRDKLPFQWFRDEVSRDPAFENRCLDKYFFVAAEELRYPEAVEQLDEAAPADALEEVSRAISVGLETTSRMRWNVIKNQVVSTLV